jgi:hypothetical protein
MAISARLVRIALAGAAALPLGACQEDRQIVARDLGKQIEFSIEDSAGEPGGCIWSLAVFDEARKDKPMWAAGLDDNAECRSSITAPGPTPGYSAEGSPHFERDGPYVVQAFGPGFNVAKTFKRSELAAPR